MKALSLKLFSNQELLPLLSVMLLMAGGIFLIAHFGFFKWLGSFRKKTPGAYWDKMIPIGYQKSKQAHVWTEKDWLAVTLITILYAVVSLWQLGSGVLPETRWQPASDDEFFILEIKGDNTHFDQVYILSGEGDNNALDNGYQIGLNNIQITGSHDQNHWELITDIESSSYLQWNIYDGSWDYRYIGVIVKNSHDVINEIGFKSEGNDYFLPVQVILVSNDDNPYDPASVIDEQDKITIRPTYLNQTYFDEIYHVRNAQEIAEGQFMYASVHPLLGTQIIAFFIKLLGNNPFAWRIGGALFGIAMLPLFYALCKTLFSKTRYAALGTLLFASDFMHLTTSRIATLEPFSVFFIMLMSYFMIRYCQMSFYDSDFRTTLKYLLLSGIAMGLGIAVKWTAVYAGIGLAVLFFLSLFRRWQEYKRAIKSDRCTSFEQHVVAVFPKYFLKTAGWCCIWFIVVPLIIYFAAYIPCQIYRGESWSLAGVIKQTVGMYKYHANLEATHPFQSVWWQWILDIRPIWYYHQVYDNLVYTISAFGNPLIWWTGMASVIFSIYLGIRKKSQTAVTLVVCYLAQLVPWMLVTRCVFIYHYYPSVPFLILALVYAISCLDKWNPEMKRKCTIFAVICFVLFLLFLPATAGFGTTKAYIDSFLRWFPSWYFG